MKKLLLVLIAASSIFTATAMANEATEMNADTTVSLEQIDQMKETVLAVKYESDDLEMWGCPKGYLLAVKRCWKNWKLVRCGYFCHKPPPPPCCHGEGKPE